MCSVKKNQGETRFPMFTKVMKWLSIMALLLGMFLTSSTSFRIGLEMVVCVAALVVTAQALRTHKYFWAIGFVATAVLFNPIVPVTLSHKAFLLLDLVCIGTFLISLGVLRWDPTLSIPSITGRTPGSTSL
jgi:hypothetical protein